MSNPWFRLYTETVDDEKLRLLAFEDRWHFIAILCCKGKGILDEPNQNLVRRKVAVKLGLDLATMDEVARRLAEVGLVDAVSLQPISWNKRQFSSDQDPTRNERKKRFLEKQRDKKENGQGTDEERTRNGSGNASVTHTDTDTDTDTELTTTSLSLSEFSEENSFRDIEVPTSSAEGDLLGDPKPAKAPKFTTKFCQQVIDAYHEILPELPKAQILTTERQRLIRKHFEYKLTAHKDGLGPDIENWRGYFSDAVRRDDWAMGRVDLKNGSPPFKAKLEYIISERGFSRIHEAHLERIARQPIARHDWRKESAVISPCVPPFGDATPQTQVCAGQTH